MKRSRLALFQSLISLLLCCSMLIGTTFAWFTDGVTSGNNTIAAGTLDIELEYRDADGNWNEVNERTEVLDKEALWEPGYTEVAYLKVTNAGNLALKYALGVGVISETGSINVAGEDFYLSDHIRFGVIESETETTYATREEARSALPTSSLIIDGPVSTKNVLNEKDDVRYVTLVVYMPEDVGNAANYATGVTPPEINLGIELVATQAEYESDSFGSNYDAAATLAAFNFPEERIACSTSAGVESDKDNNSTSGVTLTDEQASAEIPAGVKLDAGTSVLTLEVTTMDESDANITLEANEAVRSLDVHVKGIAKDNTVPMAITIKKAAPVGLNLGNYTFYHVENGETNAMEYVSSDVAFTKHNQFKYDPATGDITLYMATFSEIAMVADTVNAWNGDIAKEFASGTGDEGDPYIIANADQLAYLNEVISNENDNYGDKLYKLVADINLGYGVQDHTYTMFYPIGYHKVGGSIATVGLDDAPEAAYIIEEDTRTPGSTVDVGTATEWYTYGGAFKGTFDGAGHTVANIYQNTWQMKGNYDGNYWNAAMGLFGYVNGGTVKNLTVENFQSDGEFTPTGVIAAYAANSTFENIAITNCNPRVYNTGNGGIVGIGGNTGDPDTYKLTFNNITIDNTNTISALWGSWDVACGGLVGMFRGAGHVHMTNCHVAAQIDVFNDVCGNYQYYWYRYAGMMVGTNKNMITDANGYTVPETSKFHAKNCTVHFGEWNDYYYCELVANSLASYTHDHQFSRLEQIQNVSEIQDANGNWNKTGNFIVMNGKIPTDICYHIVKNSDGTLKRHQHDDAGEETVNGKTVLKEDNQRIYLPFNQLFTGYGWGVKHIPVYNGEDYAFEGITILDREEAKSVKKFEGKVSQLANGAAIKLGDIFNFVDNGVELVPDALTVAVTNLDNNNPVSAEFVRDSENWENGTIEFTGVGEIWLTIQDYYFCTPTTIEVEVIERTAEEKFETKFTGDFLYRVGNTNAVALSSLFKAKDDVTIGETVSVVVETVNGNAAGTYTANTSDWTKGTIKFSGTGIVKVTIQDYDYCTPTVLYLEVVDAVNATTATSATKNNVVLLNDCGFGSLEVSGGYTLYGNGFTMTCGSDSAALDMGYSFVTLNNGILDNVQIVCPNFDYAVLYKSNMTESGNRSETTDRTRYYNVKSGVMASGNSQILNSRISGGRAAVNVSGGNCVIDNSRIELGAVASILVGSANSLTLRDVTLMQKPTASTYNPSKTLMGFSVLFVCDADGNTAPVTLEGTLVQNAWVDENDKQYVPSAGQSIISTVLGKTDYLHDLDGDGTKESLNLGFAYMPESLTSKVNTTTITDNRTNKNDVPYDYAEVSILNGKTYVYSYKNTKGTDGSFKTESEYNPNKYGDIITVTYADNKDGLENGKSYGTDGWVYELNVDLDKLPGYALDFSKLSMTVNGTPATDFKVDGNAKPASPVAVTAGGVTYTLTATIDDKEYTATYKVTGTETSKESPSLVASNYEAGLCVASSYGGTWHGAAPALEGIQIKYWSVAEKQYKTIKLSDYTPTTKGQLNGTNTTWTYSPANGDFTLTLTGGQVHSSNNVYAMPVVCDGKLYFVAAKSNGLVNSGNSARTIPVSYTFKDNNNGDVLTFSHTWSVAENKDAQYKYSDFCNGTLTKLEKSSGGDTCLAEGTMITLAGGSKRAVEDLRKGDLVMAYDHVTGEITSNEVIIVVKTEANRYYKNTFVFDDGTELVTINEHGIYDLNLRKYVNIDHENAEEFIGHKYIAVDSNGKISTKTLVEVETVIESGYKYDIVTDQTLNYVAEDTLSVTHVLVDVINSFDFDDHMRYDQRKMQKDIEKYGLYTYDEWEEYCDISVFEQYNIPVMKVGISKGLYTKEYIIGLINTYVLDENVQIID